MNAEYKQSLNFLEAHIKELPQELRDLLDHAWVNTFVTLCEMKRHASQEQEALRAIHKTIDEFSNQLSNLESDLAAHLNLTTRYGVQRISDAVTEFKSDLEVLYLPRYQQLLAEISGKTKGASRQIAFQAFVFEALSLLKKFKIKKSEDRLSEIIFAQADNPYLKTEAEAFLIDIDRTSAINKKLLSERLRSHFNRGKSLFRTQAGLLKIFLNTTTN